MNYKMIYERLISNSKLRHPSLGNERHHIIPKCLGGSNSIDNLVSLTFREHFICHMLLCKIYPQNAKLKYAMFKLNNYHGSNKGSKSYKRVRSKFIEHQRQRMLTNNPMKGKDSPMKGKNHSSETKTKISKRTSELFKDPEYRKKHRDGVSFGVSGSKHPFYGKHHSETSLKKASKTKGCRSFNVFKDHVLIGTWWSQSQCCRDLNLKSVGNLNTSLKLGTLYRGFRFEYLTLP